MHRVYAFSASGSEELGSVTFRSPFSLWFGPEWPGAGAPVGTPAGTPTGTQSRVSVRIASRPHVESLNLAVAVSLAAYVAGKRVEGRK
jgi:tRNA(Leu) C34 or U34 (ribose-2'-O)-methylase TrmL